MSKLEFDEKKYLAEVDRLFKEGDTNHWQFDQWSSYFARWQHAQDLSAYQRLLDEAINMRRHLVAITPKGSDALTRFDTFLQSIEGKTELTDGEGR